MKTATTIEITACQMWTPDTCFDSETRTADGIVKCKRMRYGRRGKISYKNPKLKNIARTGSTKGKAVKAVLETRPICHSRENAVIRSEKSTKLVKDKEIEYVTLENSIPRNETIIMPTRIVESHESFWMRMATASESNRTTRVQ